MLQDMHQACWSEIYAAPAVLQPHLLYNYFWDGCFKFAS